MQLRLQHLERFSPVVSLRGYRTFSSQKMKIAVEGCCHGELDAIYASIKRLETEKSQKIDLLLIGGDFQSVRNNADLACIAMPEKYRRLGDFAAYYNGTKTAPVPTIFIGGNHEASNYLHELFYGGWVAPNIYYLGASGVVNFRGITIAGLSGIFKRYHYHQGHHERLPFTEDSKRSIYHIREFDVHKLSLLKQPTVFMSHDWPTGIHRYGDHKTLLAKKPHFRDDIERGQLGSEPAEMLLGKLRPKYWFSAHLHVKFAAFVDHDAPTVEDAEGAGEDVEGEIVLEDSDDETQDVRQKSPGKRSVSVSATDSDSKRQRQDSAQNVLSTQTKQTTRFLALDKCLPHRDFLQVLDIETDPNTPFSDTLSYDHRWLAITKTFHPYLSTAIKPHPMPSEEELQSQIGENLEWVNEHIKDLTIPENFQVVAPAHDERDPPPSRKQPPFYYNPQTEAFCKMLEINGTKMPR